MFWRKSGVPGHLEKRSVFLDFPGGAVVRNPPATAGDVRDAVPSLGPLDPPEEGMAAHPCSCLEDPRGRGAWRLWSLGSQTRTRPRASAHTGRWAWGSAVRWVSFPRRRRFCETSAALGVGRMLLGLRVQGQVFF